MPNQTTVTAQCQVTRRARSSRPHCTVLLQERDGSDDQDMASDLRVAAREPGHNFPFPPGLPALPTIPALEALHKQKELLGGNIVLPASSPQGLLKSHSNLFPGSHPSFPIRPPSQVRTTTKNIGTELF